MGVFVFFFLNVFYKSSCLLACLSSLPPNPPPHDEVPFLLHLPLPQLRGAQRYKVPTFVS